MKTKERREKGTATLLVVLLLIFTIIVSGCGSGSTTDKQQGEEPKQTPKSKESLTAEIKILMPWGLQEKDHLEKMNADFNKEYPNIKWKLMEQKVTDLPTLVAAGDIPDLILVQGSGADLRKTNMLEELTSYVKTDGIAAGRFIGPAYDRGTTSDGKVWTLPWHVDPNFTMVYSKGILDQFGVQGVPKINTLQEMGDFLKKFWKAENGEQAMTTFEPYLVYGTFNALLTFSFMNGATEETFYNPATNKVGFNDPKIVETLEWMLKFRRETLDQDRFNKLNASLPKGSNRFQAGKSAVEVFTVPVLKDAYEKDKNLGFTNMPDKSLWVGGWNFAMSKGGKKENKQAAWESLKWLTSTKEGAESQQTHIGWISGIKDNPHLQKLAKENPVYQVASDVLQKVQRNFVYISIGNWRPEFDKVYNAVFRGEMEPKAAMDHITKYMEAMIAEQK